VLFAIVVFFQESDCSVTLFEVGYWIAIDDFAQLVDALEFLELVVQRFELALVSYVHQLVELLKVRSFLFVFFAWPFRLASTTF
jgi:hypothetical protein